MWSTDIASLPFFGSKFANAQAMARNDEGTRSDGASGQGLTTALRWLGIAICMVLCLPVFLFSLFLFGFVLLPLLPLIGVGLIASTGGSPTARPARPRLPSAAAAAPPFHQVQAA